MTFYVKVSNAEGTKRSFRVSKEALVLLHEGMVFHETIANLNNPCWKDWRESFRREVCLESLIYLSVITAFRYGYNIELPDLPVKKSGDEKTAAASVPVGLLVGEDVAANTLAQ